jgi:hypothetical protein
MSKLSKAITASMTGDVRATRGLNLRYTDVSIHSSDHALEKQVLLQAKISTKAWIRESPLKGTSSEDDLFRQALSDVKRAMIEEVFGEFRPLIIEMRAALYDEDQTRLRTLLAELETKMFHED